MKRLLIAVVICMAGLSGIAAFDSETIVCEAVDTDASTLIQFTNSNVRGFIHEITMYPTGAGITAGVSVAYRPLLWTNATDQILVAGTNHLNEYFSFRPQRDGTDSRGVILTNAVPSPFLIVGEAIVVTLSNASSTNAVIHVNIKYEKRD